jgi:hypothetical protein
MQMQVERFESTQHRETDPARANRAEVHAFNIVATSDAVGDVPPTTNAGKLYCRTRARYRMILAAISLEMIAASPKATLELFG